MEKLLDGQTADEAIAFAKAQLARSVVTAGQYKKIDDIHLEGELVYTCEKK